MINDEKLLDKATHNVLKEKNKVFKEIDSIKKELVVLNAAKKKLEEDMELLNDYLKKYEKRVEELNCDLDTLDYAEDIFKEIPEVGDIYIGDGGLNANDIKMFNKHGCDVTQYINDNGIIVSHQIKRFSIKKELKN